MSNVSGLGRPRWLGAAFVVMTVCAASLAATPSALAASTASRPAEHAVRWGFLIGVVVGAIILGGAAVIGAHVTMLFVGYDNRLSTSKTIAAVWTMVVFAALIAIVYANLLNHPQALIATESSGTVGQYAVLFGGPLGAAILAKQIVTNQVANPAVSKPPADSPQAKDLIANDNGDTDLGDFQYVLFNSVALFFVVSTLLHAPLKGLPHIPDVLLGLTSVAAVGYVGKKALTPVGVTAQLDPETISGAANALVRIVISGIPATKNEIRGWIWFGATQADPAIQDGPVALGQATLTTTAPQGPAAGQTADVSIITDDGAQLRAGTYTYT
jgi:hypothetical protein